MRKCISRECQSFEMTRFSGCAADVCRSSFRAYTCSCPTVRRFLVHSFVGLRTSSSRWARSRRSRRSVPTWTSCEKRSIASAREKGATVEDIAEALGLTPQAIYYRLRHEKMNLQVTPGEPNAADPALGETAESALPPESTLAAAVTDAPEDPRSSRSRSCPTRAVAGTVCAQLVIGPCRTGLGVRARSVLIRDMPWTIYSSDRRLEVDLRRRRPGAGVGRAPRRHRAAAELGRPRHLPDPPGLRTGGPGRPPRASRPGPHGEGRERGAPARGLTRNG